jgi:shikimate kinase
MLIFLIGMMGSGKTTLGKQLASELSYPFIDLDEYIEQQEHSSVAGIFEKHGQDKFRELEHKALEAIVHKLNSAIIATGGGTPCFHNNIDFMNQHGTTVFLHVPIHEISKRLLATDLTIRPLLSEKSADEIFYFLNKTLNERMQFYSRAKHTVKSESIAVNELRVILNN